MAELLTRFVDVDFIDGLTALAPAVGGGFLLGVIVALVGWLWGFVIRLGKLEL